MDIITRHKKAQGLFKKHESNPILVPDQWPYPINSVFNPAAALVDGETVLLCRVEDMVGFSHLTLARSKDGITNWVIDESPTMEPNRETHEERWGLEDPRIVWLEEQRQYAITYVSFSTGGPLVSLAITRNFKTFARLGPMLPPEDKDACLFPRRFNGRYALIHRPIVRGEAHIWISLSPDLQHWGDHQVLLKTRHAMWDNQRVGLACQPIETELGWLLFYHGVRYTTAGQIYRVGLALLDLEQPWRVLRRADEWIMGPTKLYERVGDVGDVVFPEGAIIHEDTDELYMYYGAADCTVALATASMSDIKEFIMACPEEPPNY